MHRLALASLVILVAACGPKEDFSGHASSTPAYAGPPSNYALTNELVVQRGSRTYGAANVETVSRAVHGALVVLGFPLALEQPGLIKTGPKLMASRTNGEGSVAWGKVRESYETETFSLAWVVHVEQRPEGVRVVAVPRAFFNQAELAPQQPSWNDSWLAPNWEALLREIDNNVGVH